MKDLLQINDLKVHFHVAEGIIKAVDGISFRIPKGGTVALTKFSLDLRERTRKLLKKKTLV